MGPISQGQLLFLKLNACQVLIFDGIAGLSHVNLLKSEAPLLDLARFIYYF